MGSRSVTASAIVFLLASGLAPARAKPNVLFIVVDDLRPQLKCYGRAGMVTPHMDKLASEGRRFEKAYTQIAVCAASRASFMSGMRPNHTRIFNHFTPMRDGFPGAYSLNQHFQANGYHTATVGKIYHNKGEDGYWNEEMPHHGSPLYAKSHPPGSKVSTENGGDVPDSAYGQGLVLNRAMEALERLKDTSFFLAVGFHRPHLPFTAPGKYWDLYDERSLSLPANPGKPLDAPSSAFHDWGELRTYTDIPSTGPLPESLQRRLLHGYYASTSFTDALIGRLQGKLHELGLDGNTVIVLTSDHGWSLGEHAMWGKHSNFEEAVHVPLILKVPGMAKPGVSSPGLVELVDIYPTLAEVCGLALPPGLEGSSFAPLLVEPSLPWKRAVFSQWPRGEMGYTVRTERYRYTLWGAEAELYDYRTDPDGNRNLAGSQPALARQMNNLLTEGWKKSLPPATSGIRIRAKGDRLRSSAGKAVSDGLGRRSESIGRNGGATGPRYQR